MSKVITIQDISCIGTCSMTVALPILTAMGLETIPLPTAVLSAHTAFREVAKHDLTEEIPDILDAWEGGGLRGRPGSAGQDNTGRIAFDAIYSGYLASRRQIELVQDVWKRFGKDSTKKEATIRFVDPVMGDHGKLYSGFDDAFVQAMRGLVSGASVVVPNLTEACILSGHAYRDTTDDAFMEAVVRDVAALGPEQVVLTGYQKDGAIGALLYDRESDTLETCLGEYYPVSYSGTGDIFASVCCGALAQGKTLREAAQLAVGFVHDCVRETLADTDRRWYGVSFEKVLPELMRR